MKDKYLQNKIRDISKQIENLSNQISKIEESQISEMKLQKMHDDMELMIKESKTLYDMQSYYTKCFDKTHKTMQKSLKRHLKEIAKSIDMNYDHYDNSIFQLAKLLQKKGVITLEEYIQRLSKKKEVCE